MRESPACTQLQSPPGLIKNAASVLCGSCSAEIAVSLIERLGGALIHLGLGLCLIAAGGVTVETDGCQNDSNKQAAAGNFHCSFSKTFHGEGNPSVAHALNRQIADNAVLASVQELRRRWRQMFLE